MLEGNARTPARIKVADEARVGETERAGDAHTGVGGASGQLRLQKREGSYTHMLPSKKMKMRPMRARVGSWMDQTMRTGRHRMKKSVKTLDTPLIR